MKIVHKISMSDSNNDKLNDFLQADILLEIVGNDFWVFQVTEDDVRWDNVANLIEKYKILDSIETEFTASELGRSRYLELLPSWHYGYPQPEDDFAYQAITFDLTEYCKVCGTGRKQIAPFRMKREPVWGRRSILQLNWEFDEYFVKPDVWEKIFNPMEIGCRPVLHYKSGKVLETVVQLELTETMELNLDCAAFEQCVCCGRKKYFPVTRGYSPLPLHKPSSAVFRSKQWFGSGREAHNAIIVTNDLYLVINKSALKGISFSACGDNQELTKHPLTSVQVIP